MTQHPRYQHSLEELFLHVYVVVDDWLKENQARFALPIHRTQVASYSELLTIALVGEIVAQPYESVWYWLVGESYRKLFPHLPEYSRYHRVLQNAEKLLAALALAVLPSSASTFNIVDAKPLPLAKGKRSSWASCPEASKGFSTMGVVYGFKLHALVNEQGLVERWSFAPAHHHEASVAPELIEGLMTPILGDRAYLGHPKIITLKRKNMTEPGIWNQALARLRKRIETTFSVLVGSLTLHAANLRTFRSLRTRVNLKIAAHNLIYSGCLNG